MLEVGRIDPNEPRKSLRPNQMMTETMYLHDGKGTPLK